MRHEHCAKADPLLQTIYSNLARWCNQPNFQKTLTFRVFCNRTGGKAAETVKEFQAKYPSVADRYFDMAYVDHATNGAVQKVLAKRVMAKAWDARQLQAAADRINAFNNEIIGHARKMFAMILRAGRYMNEIRPHVEASGRGWHDWIATETHLELRSAQQWCQVARCWPQIVKRAKAQHIADPENELTLTQALQLAVEQPRQLPAPSKAVSGTPRPLLVDLACNTIEYAARQIQSNDADAIPDSDRAEWNAKLAELRNAIDTLMVALGKPANRRQ